MAELSAAGLILCGSRVRLIQSSWRSSFRSSWIMNVSWACHVWVVAAWPTDPHVFDTLNALEAVTLITSQVFINNSNRASQRRRHVCIFLADFWPLSCRRRGVTSRAQLWGWKVQWAKVMRKRITQIKWQENISVWTREMMNRKLRLSRGEAGGQGHPEEEEWSEERERDQSGNRERD